MPNDRLRTALLERGLTPADLAAALNVDPKSVERWIAHGRRLAVFSAAPSLPGSWSMLVAFASVVPCLNCSSSHPWASWTFCLRVLRVPALPDLPARLTSQPAHLPASDLPVPRPILHPRATSRISLPSRSGLAECCHPADSAYLSVRTMDAENSLLQVEKDMSGKRGDMPRLSRVMEYWREQYAPIFPDLAAHWIGWGEPFCFRCGWLAPVDDTRPTLAEVWDSARGWLERAHLHDLGLGGPNTPENLVPLCRNCHDMMPAFEDRASAIAYVANGPEKSGWWQLHTDAIFGSESLSPQRKTKLMRELYLRFVESERLLTGAIKGDERAAAILLAQYPKVEPLLREYREKVSKE